MQKWNAAEYARHLKAFDDFEAEDLFYGWSRFAREKQLPPEGDWTTWLLMGGRGSGKTRAGAEWVRGLAAAKVSPIALVGETITEAIAVMVRGESGIMRVTPHRERPRLRGNALIWPNGAEAMILGANDPERFRGPQFAAAWCDELGCAAVDNGANQPNIFGDAKSAEGGRPYFSSGVPDALMQRQFLRAHARFWSDPANNPPGMVDLERVYRWTWDARPYPAFPALTDVWADGGNHHTGHWLTGRLGALASDELAVAIATDHGVDISTAEAQPPLIAGFQVTAPGTAREALQPLLEATGMRLASKVGGISLARPALRAAAEIAGDDLAETDRPLLSRRRPDPGEATGRLVLGFTDRERDYLAGSVTALRGGGNVEAVNATLALDIGGARVAAETVLAGRSGTLDTLEFSLPPSAAAVEIGDTVGIAGLSESRLEITEIRDGPERRVTARSVPAPARIVTAATRPKAGAPGLVKACRWCTSRTCRRCRENRRARGWCWRRMPSPGRAWSPLRTWRPARP